MLTSLFLDRRGLTCSVLATCTALFCLATGLGSNFDQFSLDLFARSSTRAASGDVIVVALDEATIAELGGFPTIRSRLAKLLQNISDCEPQRVLIDLAFASEHNEADDSALEAALRSFRQGSIGLPGQWTEQKDSNGVSKAELFSPLPRFRDPVVLVSVDVEPDKFGVVRDLMRSQHTHGVTLSASSEWLARSVVGDRLAKLDTRIDPNTIPVISGRDLLHHREATEAFLRNKKVVVGLTLPKVSQPIRVPVYGELPRPTYFALAAESILQHRFPHPVNSFFSILVSIPLMYVLGFVLTRMPAWLSALTTTAAMASVPALSWLLLTSSDLELPPMVPMVSTMTAFAMAEVMTRKSFQGLRHAWRAMVENVDLQLANLFHSGADSIITFSPDGVVLTINATAERMLGIKAEECLGKPLASILPEMAEEMLRTARAHQPGRLEAVLATHDTKRHVDVAVNAVTIDASWIGYASFRDISELRAREDDLRRQATQDSLTGLANRSAFERHLQISVQFASDTHQSLSVFLLDLNKFKTVNDTLGHHIGDGLLRAAADSFRRSIRSSDFVARLGGDEFAIVLAPGTTQDAAIAIAGTIKDSITAIREIEGQKVAAGASIGIAMYPDHGLTPADLLQAADFAMYDAKRNQLRYKVAELAAAR